MYKVFIADDEAWIIVGMKKLIEKSGLPFKVIGEAGNGVTTLEEIEKKRPDVVFSDIRMPGLNGLELLEEIRKRKIEVKVVFISGYAEFEYAKKAIELQAYNYLLKPVKQEELNEVLSQISQELGQETEPPEVKEEEEVSLTLMQQIVNEIQNRYTENITLTELAETYGISIGHLSNLVKQELKLPFSEYIAAKRIQKAKELLADETLSIEQIAEQTGYRDYFYFTKVFKKAVGVSPSKYRKSL